MAGRLLGLAIGCGVICDLHFLLALLVVRFGLDFFSAKSEEVLELLNVVIVFLRLVSEFFAHVETIAVPGFLAGTLVRNHRVEVLGKRVVIRILVADAADRYGHHLHHHRVCHGLLLSKAHETGLCHGYSRVAHRLHCTHLKIGRISLLRCHRLVLVGIRIR